MNLKDVTAFETLFRGASDIADAAIAIENKELCLAALTFMSDFMYSMGIVIPETFTLLEYEYFFGESAYDSITVERNSSGSFTAKFYKKFHEDFCDAYGIAPILERTEIGDSYDNARSHVMTQISNWLESLKVKNGWRNGARPLSMLIHQRERDENTPGSNKADEHIEAKSNSTQSDTDDGLFEATKGCCGNCAACDHEEE